MIFQALGFTRQMFPVMDTVLPGGNLLQLTRINAASIDWLLRGSNVTAAQLVSTGSPRAFAGLV